jgi:DNA-binding SARP family transcriptional activator
VSTEIVQTLGPVAVESAVTGPSENSGLGDPVTIDEPASVNALQLLDGFEFRCDGHVVDFPLGTQRLIAFLAMHDKPVLRTYVAGCLWLDKSTDRSHANLRSALWRLRNPAGHIVQSRGAHVRLHPSVSVDVRDANALALACIGDKAEIPSAETTRLLLAGDLLPDWYDEWVVVERERMRQLRLHALEALCARLVRERRFAEAVDVGLVAVAAEPLRESTHRALILAHLAEGNGAEAIHQFQLYRTLVWDALGIRPSRLLQNLLTDVLDDGAGERFQAPNFAATVR